MNIEYLKLPDRGLVDPSALHHLSEYVQGNGRRAWIDDDANVVAVASGVIGT